MSDKINIVAGNRIELRCGMEPNNFGVELCYPCIGDPDKNTYVSIGLEHVRAADDIRIHYDGNRDGWAISQMTRFNCRPEEEYDPAWKEVAFIPAWGSQTEEDKAIETGN